MKQHNCCVQNPALIQQLSVILFRFSLCSHVFQFGVQLPVQVGFLIGVHGHVFPPTPSVKHPFFANSHASMRFGFVSTSMHLKGSWDRRNGIFKGPLMAAVENVHVWPLGCDDWDNTACCSASRAVRELAQKLYTWQSCTHFRPSWRRWWGRQSRHLQQQPQRCRRHPSLLFYLQQKHSCWDLAKTLCQSQSVKIKRIRPKHLGCPLVVGCSKGTRHFSYKPFADLFFFDDEAGGVLFCCPLCWAFSSRFCCSLFIRSKCKPFRSNGGWCRSACVDSEGLGWTFSFSSSGNSCSAGNGFTGLDTVICLSLPSPLLSCVRPSSSATWWTSRRSWELKKDGNWSSVRSPSFRKSSTCFLISEYLLLFSSSFVGVVFVDFWCLSLAAFMLPQLAAAIFFPCFALLGGWSLTFCLVADVFVFPSLWSCA